MKTLLNYPHFSPTLGGFSLMDDALQSFDRILRNPAFMRGVPSAWTGAPEFTVTSDSEGWLLRAEVPGLSPDKLEIEAQADRLLVRARSDAGSPEGYRAVHRERSPLSFERSFAFERGFDSDNVHAELKHGVLTVRIPRRPEEKPRAITVKAG